MGRSLKEIVTILEDALVEFKGMPLTPEIAERMAIKAQGIIEDSFTREEIDQLHPVITVKKTGAMEIDFKDSFKNSPGYKKTLEYAKNNLGKAVRDFWAAVRREAIEDLEKIKNKGSNQDEGKKKG